MALKRDSTERISEAKRRLRGEPLGRSAQTIGRRSGSAIDHRDLQRARERLQAARS